MIDPGQFCSFIRLILPVCLALFVNFSHVTVDIAFMFQTILMLRSRRLVVCYIDFALDMACSSARACEVEGFRLAYIGAEISVGFDVSKAEHKSKEQLRRTSCCFSSSLTWITALI